MILMILSVSSFKSPNLQKKIIWKENSLEKNSYISSTIVGYFSSCDAREWHLDGNAQYCLAYWALLDFFQLRKNDRVDEREKETNVSCC